MLSQQEVISSSNKNKETQTSHAKKAAVAAWQVVVSGSQIIFEIGKTLTYPSLVPAFFGKPILSGVPHVRAYHPFGQLAFNADLTDRLTMLAQSTSKGIATYWAGPFLPIIYVATNKARHTLVKQGHMGTINKNSENYLRWLTGGNHVMTNFPAFMSVYSDRYNVQRQFLLKFLHGGAKHRLPVISKASEDFLKNYSIQYGRTPRSLRQFITILILHTSSHLLSLTNITLDKLYLDNQEYRHVIDHVAQYGISERGNAALEQTLFELFCETFKCNFERIQHNNINEDFIKCIFTSMELEFPEKFEDFFKLSCEVQHNIAMTFVSTAIGGLIHSTVNTLDWALARLLKNKNKMKEFEELMFKNSDLQLTEEWIFDKEGPLFEIAEWVLHNVYMNPPFGHEFFLNSKPLDTTLPDGSVVTIPGRGFVIVNYVACNRSNEEVITRSEDEMLSPSKKFTDCLQSKSTTARFIMNKEVASFGGSLINRNNKISRICPGAKLSLSEQRIIIAQLVQFSIKTKDDIDLAVDRTKHPSHTRVDEGEIVIGPKSQDKAVNLLDEKVHIDVDDNANANSFVPIKNESLIIKGKERKREDGFFKLLKSKIVCPVDRSLSTNRFKFKFHSSVKDSHIDIDSQPQSITSITKKIK